ncbi:MAG: sigma-70 family RNA polymerase sigma factor [Clostridia bacterium]|nr:sigma-70 family RNA polymerase sigma factor [Clostridia bacterium]
MLFFLMLVNDEQERDALEKIYEENFDWMLKTAFYFLKNNEDAEDAIQEVFVGLVKNKTDIPTGDEERLRAYLFICIRNSAFALAKKKNYDTDISDEFIESLSTEEDIQDRLIKKDFYNEVLAYIKTMPPIYKDILVLNVLYGKSSHKIAKILQIPKKTAESRLTRAKQLLNKQFKEFDI